MFDLKFKTGDEVRVKRTNKETMYKHIEGTTVLILDNVCDDLYKVFDCIGGQWILDEDMLEPADSKTLRMADGTVIGEFAKEGIIGEFKGIPVYATGGTVSIHDLPISEWYNPMRLTFKNGSSIEALPQKDDTVRGENHFCTGFRGGKIPTLSEIKGFATPSLDLSVFSNDGISAKNGGKNSMKFTFYVTEGYRIDKSNNTKIPTMTTEVLVNGKDYQYSGSAICDKADYLERDGILNAIANAVCCDSFDREYEKLLANKKRRYDVSCKCKICGRNYYEDEKTGKRTPFTPEDARKHEEWHEQNKKNKREKYLIRKEAKRRLAEAEREGKIEQTMKELYKK